MSEERDFPRRTDQKPASVFVRKVPRHVHAQFKAWCARRNITIQKAITDYMRNCVENDNLARIGRRRRAIAGLCE